MHLLLALYQRRRPPLRPYQHRQIQPRTVRENPASCTTCCWISVGSEAGKGRMFALYLSSFWLCNRISSEASLSRNAGTSLAITEKGWFSYNNSLPATTFQDTCSSRPPASTAAAPSTRPPCSCRGPWSYCYRYSNFSPLV